MSAQALSDATQRFHGDVSRWPRSRWTTASASGHRKSDVAHTLVQRVADLAARAEGQPYRAVPHLDGDSTVVDQLKVVVADLLAAGPPAAVLSEATVLIEEAHANLAH